MKDGVSWEEAEAAYDSLVNKEPAPDQRLDSSKFEMGDWLSAIQATVDDIRALSERYPVGHRRHRAVGTLAQLHTVAEMIPQDKRNPALSWSAHVEAVKIRDLPARFEIIASPPGRTAQDMAGAVLKVRRRLGEIRTFRREEASETMRRLGCANPENSRGSA